MDLSWFFDQWVFRSGFMSLAVSWETLPGAGGPAHVRVRLRQEAGGDSLFRGAVDVRAVSGDAAADTSFWILEESQTFDWRLPFEPDSLLVDPEHWVPVRAKREPWVPDTSSAGGGWSIRPNFPNPFSGETVIWVDRPPAGAADGHPGRLCVYNLLGRRVKTIASGIPPDSLARRCVWDGTDDAGNQLPSGIYILRLEAGPLSVERKIALRR
jgi:hypothetical protein